MSVYECVCARESTIREKERERQKKRVSVCVCVCEREILLVRRKERGAERE